MKNFSNLFNHELDDLYSVETQSTNLLSQLAEAASTQKLKDAIEKHSLETQQHARTLEKVAREQNTELGKHECKVMNVIVEEAQKIISADYPPEVRDAAIISCLQRLEHYEITLYGTLRAFAKHLGLKEAERLLQETSRDEWSFDKKLTDIAMGTLFASGVNQKAIRKSA